ncbi:putative RNA methyltransferase [Fundicoccus culcitae]|uniref:Methyltransferase domain-containing protein n=1 Tax=Fundicoccus culcitae TaxID=2969821 RepID=A0ABY5P342_9LACT|nr:methyltransferase domain-containing protein [Fundicoccus culcitae]UUX32984.1 methyltransferase domain-containing protein [Fundicoccus culcitae]
MAELMKKTKLAQSLDWLDNHPEVFQCIHCHAPLKRQGNSLVCSNNHRFDSAKQGYFYLSKQATQQTDYDKTLFQHRRYIITESAFYRPLLVPLMRYLNTQLSNGDVVLDAGSGEGSYLHVLHASSDKALSLIGVDLAKDGIQLATSYNGEMLSLVADLAQLPLQNQRIDIILSILSPANYTEFKRVLKDDGQIVKVIAEKDYLIEIRQALIQLGFAIQEKYDNQPIIEKFQEAFPENSYYQINEVVELTMEELERLLQMTPLTWHLKADNLAKLKAILPSHIHLNMGILIGHKKRAKIPKTES